MCNSPADQKIRPIVTTSWDDGHPSDLKLAELLFKYGARGTFYVPAHYGDQPILKPSEIRHLDEMGMEIGSHTMSHPVMTQITPAAAAMELQDSKKYLEDILGKQIYSFCYPKGRFNRLVRSKVMEAGYSLARTTVAFKTDLEFDPFSMPVSYQFHPHDRFTHVRHALKEGNLSGLFNWCSRWGFEVDMMALTNKLSRYINVHGGVLHFWGHSWEIDQGGLWSVLEDVLVFLSEHREYLYLTNSQVLMETPGNQRMVT